MLREIGEVKQLLFRAVLMDSWYAITKGMKYVDEQEKICYCPIKRNKLIKVEGGYQRVDNLSWEQAEKCQLVRPRGFPAHKQVKLYRVIISTNNREYIIISNPDSLSPE